MMKSSLRKALLEGESLYTVFQCISLVAPAVNYLFHLLDQGPGRVECDADLLARALEGGQLAQEPP